MFDCTLSVPSDVTLNQNRLSDTPQLQLHVVKLKGITKKKNVDTMSYSKEEVTQHQIVS